MAPRHAVRAANTAANCHIPGEGCDTLPTDCRICRPVATAALSRSVPQLAQCVWLAAIERGWLAGEDAGGPEANVQQSVI